MLFDSILKLFETPSPREKLLAAFCACTDPANDAMAGLPMAPRMMETTPQSGAVLAALRFDPKSTDVVIIERFKAQWPGEGAGSLALEKIGMLADRFNVRLAVAAAHQNPAITEWLDRHGFKPNGPPDLLVRTPGADPLTRTL